MQALGRLKDRGSVPRHQSDSCSLTSKQIDCHDAELAPLIVHIIYRLDVGGLENGLINLINLTPVARYRHAIVCLTEAADFRRRLNDSSVPIFALHKRPGKDPGVYWRLWRQLRTLHPAIVHTRNLGTLDAVIPAVLAGVRVRVHGEHGWEVNDLHGRSKRYALLRRGCNPFIARYVTVSRHIETWLNTRIGLPRKKITQVYNGVDTTKFYPAATRRLPALPQFADPNCFVIGTVGRMHSVKDPLTLVHAFLDLRKRLTAHARRLRLVLIGDGPLRAEALALLEGVGAGGVAWLPGSRDDVAGLLQMFDVFVLPSLNEGISNTILEAMATGLPVIATRVGGNPELVAHGRTGTLVPHSDAKVISKSLQEYIENPRLRRNHGRAGRERVERDFSLPTMVSRYLQLYDELLTRQSAAPAGQTG